MKKTLNFILATLIINTLLMFYYVSTIEKGLDNHTPPPKSHYVYEWREISNHRWSDLNKSIIVDSWKKRGDVDWEKKAWKEIRGVDLEGWEYAGTLSSSEKIIILVRKRVIDV